MNKHNLFFNCQHYGCKLVLTNEVSRIIMRFQNQSNIAKKVYNFIGVAEISGLKKGRI